METIASMRQRPGFAEMVRKIQLAGTDNLNHFGAGYELEGGYSLQQHPEEFASLVMLLQNESINTYLEIGAASGGAARFIFESLPPAERGRCFVMIDDHGHHRWPEQEENFEAIDLTDDRKFFFIGDSHSLEAREWLKDTMNAITSDFFCGPYLGVSVAFVDGDHSYVGVKGDLALVIPRMRKRGLIVLHDIVACEGVKRAWEELRDIAYPIAEFVADSGRPLGIGVGRLRE